MASARAERCSALLCPYGWCWSAGRPATPTAKNVSSAATKSVPECRASEIRPRLPVEPRPELQHRERAGGQHGDRAQFAAAESYSRSMKICPNCGRENAEDASFCSACGNALNAAVAAREERKVVTVLFCDLVGSTARADLADPEDVRALLSSYHDRVRAELERFGGTVEKFIGDAVMALFGAPIAHEDDPERAVRAALAIRDWATDEQTLEVRIGITTGEALVSLGARPSTGEAWPRATSSTRPPASRRAHP